jgi:hypothetical protein
MQKMLWVLVTALRRESPSFLELDLYFSDKMEARIDWINSQAAVNETALAAGDGCHHEEAKALSDYLSGNLLVQEAAERIVTPVLGEADPPSELYRLWGLLSDALVELKDDRQKILDLLATIQSLPPHTLIDWSRLSDFGNMWSDLNRLHLHGPDSWEKEDWTDDRKAELYHHFETIGRIEAEMFTRGLGGASADWGYKVINLVCSSRAGLDVLMFDVHAWLECAGMQLRHNLRAKEIRSYTRPVSGALYGLQGAVSCTMEEHWQTWTEALLKLSGDQSPLSIESRKLAAVCFTLMSE